MASESSRKKQKGRAGQSINVSYPKPEEDTLGPVFAVFPSTKPSNHTPYSLYSSTGSAGEASGPTVVATQTDQIIFESRNQLGRRDEVEGEDDDEEQVGEGSGHAVQYLLGVHDPRTNTLTLHSAPLHSLATSVVDIPAPAPVQSSSFMGVQRAILGTAFGTKKAIREIRAQERNKLDHESFGIGNGVQSLLQSSIAGASGSLPSALLIEEAANLSRPIPPPNFEAKEPKDVYKMDDVVSRAELDEIDLSALCEGATMKDRNQSLPFRKSTFIANRIRNILPNREEGVEGPEILKDGKDKYRLQLLVHLSVLFFLRQEATRSNHGTIDLLKLKERMGKLGEGIAVQRLMDRYTEASKGRNGSEERKVTSGMEIKLLSYLLVVVLKLDNWSTDIGIIAKDLAIGESKFVCPLYLPLGSFADLPAGLLLIRVQELFRSLGCTVVPPTKSDKDRLVASGAVSSLTEAGKIKKAVLKVPLSFPKERKGMSKK